LFRFHIVDHFRELVMFFSYFVTHILIYLYFSIKFVINNVAVMNRIYEIKIKDE